LTFKYNGLLTYVSWKPCYRHRQHTDFPEYVRCAVVVDEMS